MKEYKVNYIDLSTGEKIAYRKTDDKENLDKKTIVLIHGNMTSSVHFERLMEKLEKDYRVYAIDMAGFGDSSYNRKIKSLHDFSRDVTEFIKALNLKEVYLLGWSTGGGVALETAVDNEDRVKEVFLLSSVPVFGMVISKLNVNSWGTMQVDRIHLKKDIRSDFPTKQHAHAIKNKDREFFKLVWDRIYKARCPEKNEYKRYLDAMMKQRNLVDVVYCLTNFNMTTSFNGLNYGTGRIYQLRCPVVVMHGSRDFVVSMNDAKKSASFIGEKAEFIEFEGCGHSLITDDLDRVYGVISQRV